MHTHTHIHVRKGIYTRQIYKYYIDFRFRLFNFQFYFSFSYSYSFCLAKHIPLFFFVWCVRRIRYEVTIPTCESRHTPFVCLCVEHFSSVSFRFSPSFHLFACSRGIRSVFKLKQEEKKKAMSNVCIGLIVFTYM